MYKKYMKYFDSHCHLQLTDFDMDREEVLARMKENDVGAVVVGTDYASSVAAIELAHKHDFLWAAVGLHPNDTPDEDFDMAAFRELAAHPKVVAIGECGLDYFRLDHVGDRIPYMERQKEKFAQQIALAVEMDKTLIVHCRPSKGSMDAHDDLFDIFADHALWGGVVPRAIAHFFSSTTEVAERYLALGCVISFPCTLTFTDMYNDVVRAVPLEKMLIETDSPFAAPKSHRGKRNEPSFVKEVVPCIARLKDISEDEVRAVLYQNALRVFRV